MGAELLRQLHVIEALPASSGAHRGEEQVFQRLRGSRISRIGAPSIGGIEGGGLVIDYVRNGTHGRVVFGFNENGMWIEFDSLTATQDEFQE